MEAQLYPQDIRTAVVPVVTTEAITKYVDTTGSDATGNGTAALPYATVARAMRDIPMFVRHKCKILVAAGDYPGGWPSSIAPIFEDDGSLAIIGVGTPVVVSGPHTVTGVANLGTGGQHISVGAGGLGAVDGLCGQTLVIATGGHPGYAYQVGGNAANSIDIALSVDPVQNGDTFNLVRPAAKIAVDGADFLYQSRTQYPAGAFAWNNCRLVLHNLWLDASASAITMELFTFKSLNERYSGFWLDFVTVTGNGASYETVSVMNANINQWDVYSNDYVVEGTTGLANLQAFGKPGFTLNAGGNRLGYDLFARGFCTLLDWANKGLLWLSGAQVEAWNVCTGGIGEVGDSVLTLGWGLVIGDASQEAIFVERATAVLSDVHVLRGTKAISSGRRAHVSLNSVTCDVIGITGYAADLGVFSLVRTADALAAFLGAAGAYRFMVPAGGPITAANWPAATGTGATDALGSFVTFGN